MGEESEGEIPVGSGREHFEHESSIQWAMHPKSMFIMSRIHGATRE